jgi:hypothetical protein
LCSADFQIAKIDFEISAKEKALGFGRGLFLAFLAPFAPLFPGMASKTRLIHTLSMDRDYFFTRTIALFREFSGLLRPHFGASYPQGHLPLSSREARFH